MGLSITTAPFPARTAVEPQSPPLGQMARTLVGIAPVLLVVFLNAIARADLDPTLRLLGSAVCLLGCLPAVYHGLTRKSSLPFMPLYALLFIGYYGTPVFLDQRFTQQVSDFSISDQMLVDAETVVLLGTVTLLLGYYLPTKRFLAFVPQMRRGLEESSGVQMGWILVALGLAIAGGRGFVPTRFQAFAQILQELGNLGLALLFYYYLQGRLPRLQTVAVMILIPGMAIVDVSRAGVSPIVQHFLPLLGTYWIVRRKVLWKTALVVALIIIPVSGVKSRFREVDWNTNGGLNVVERVSLYYNLISDGFKSDDNFYSDCLQVTTERMNQVSTLAVVQVLTPSVVPYWGGATYVDFYWSFIPRFLYPDKPGKILGQAFGHRYGLLNKSDNATSFNFPQLVEFYANFGIWGVAGGMLLLGFAQRMVYHSVTAPDAHVSVTLLATIILSRLFSIDSDLSLVYGGVMLNVFAMLVVLAVLRARRIHLPMDIFRLRW
jgi:hypothetical protein